jgi:hypothetical protein
MSDLSAGTVALPIHPDTTGFGATMARGIQSEASKQSGAIGKVGKVVGLGLLAGAGIALGGIAAIIKTGIGEAKDASAGTAQLAAGIKSTGNAAHVSVDGLNALASSIQGYSGQTDDSIVKSEQLLLTFTGIKNNGPDKIFDLATKASADMAAKMGGDASGSAILLGKALNDPVKGITALTRVGVSFSAGQKKAIDAMVKTGNTAGAQKIILKELNTEFGGAAKAAGNSLPGQLARGKRAFEDLSQSVVETLLPIVVPAIEWVMRALKTAAPYAQKFAAVFAKDVRQAIDAVGPTIKSLAIEILPKIVTVFRTLFDVVTTKVVPAIVSVTGFMSKHMTTLKLIAAVIAAILIPHFIALGVQAILSAVKQGVAWAVSNAAALAAIVLHTVVIALMVAGWVLMGVQSLLNAARMAAAWLIAMGPVAIVIAIVIGLVALIIANWSTIKRVTLAVFKAISDAISGAISWVVNFVKSHWQLLIGILLGPLGIIVGLVISHFGQIKSAVSSAIGWVSNKISSVMGAISGAWSRVWNGLTDTVSSVFGGIKGIVKGIANTVIGTINTMIGAIDSLHITLPSINTHIPGVGKIGGETIGFNIPTIPNLADGGVVLPEPGGRIVRVAEAGKAEAVVPLDSNRGRDLLGDKGKAGTVINVHPRQGQSEHEIGLAAARQLGWEARTA